MKKSSLSARLKCFIRIFLFLLCGRAQAQNPTLPQVLPPTPNAASLGIYGQVPVSLYSGLPNISIPIGEVRAGDISVPISLNYHGGGIRPDSHSGWVGLGWDLNAGGVITRRVNGLTDEFVNLSGIGDSNLYSYYFHCSKGANPNWAAFDTIQSYFNFTPSGGLSVIYPSPDEFIFNFGKYSGSFFYNTQGKWQVRSKDPVNIVVKEQLLNNYPMPTQTYGDQVNKTYLRRIFYQFTLTTPDGTAYVFGGTPSSIEFTRSGSSPPAPDQSYSTIVPMSWYLTSITSSSGQKISLNYLQDSTTGIQAPLSSFIGISQYTISGQSAQSNYDVQDFSGSITNPTYLVSITAPNETVNFARSRSNELNNYDSTILYANTLAPALVYPDLSKKQTVNDIRKEIKWFKLDSISFYSASSGFLKKFVFNYIQQTTQRLVLDSLTETGWAGYSKPPYVFGYDPTPLPPYNAQMLDHWGYYNGHNYFVDSPVASNKYTLANLPGYTKYRNSNPTYTKAGILTSIKYPTGGSTQFTWEPHDFSKVVKQVTQQQGAASFWQIYYTVTDTSSNAQTGGMRIRAITNLDPVGNVLTTKQYYYRKNYSTGGTSSSGSLAGVPNYLDQGGPIAAGTGTWLFGTPSLTYWYWHDNIVDPLSFTDGNNVTYSEVTEKLSDSSYTVNTFSNHDQGTYLDKPPVGGAYLTPYQWQLDPGNSMSLDRGKLLTKSDYTASGLLLRKAKYDYDTSVNRLNYNIRLISLTPLNFGAVNTGRATAYLDYTFPQYMTRETDTLWDQNGQNPVVSVHSTSYDTAYRLMTADSTYNSNGDLAWRTYQHPPEMLGDADSAIYRQMLNNNMVLPTITQTEHLGAVQTKYTKTNYWSPYSGIFVPQSVMVQLLSNPVETRLLFPAYDTKANILSMLKAGDLTTSYIWGYRQTLPVAEVKNAVQSDIAYTSFEADSTGNWNSYPTANIVTVATGGAMPPTGTKYYQLTTSAPLVRAGLNPAQTYVLSYWTTKGSPSSVTGTISGYPITGKTINGWTYCEHKITGQSTITLSDNTSIDEARIYPATAQMTSYTYDPAIGVTSVCDVNNRVTYYSYDDFSRLQLVLDQDRNIVKRYCYGYNGASQDCNLILYSSPADSGYFSKACTNDSTSGPSVKYLIPAGKYTSYISQAYVNSLANADVAANGPAYANQYGTCVAPAPVTLYYTKSLNRTTTLSMTNTVTGKGYSFSLSKITSTQLLLGTVPPGTYSVTLGANGNSTSFSFNGYVQNTPNTSLYIPSITLPAGGQGIAAAQ